MKTWKILAFFSCTVVLAILPLLVHNPFVLHLLILGLVYAVITSNWDLVVGYSGIFNFGHLAFFAIGAYSAPIIGRSFGISPWLCLPIGGVLAAIGSLVIALPVLRVRGLYFSLLTYVFGQIFYSLVLLNPGNITGGSQGLMSIPALRLGSITLNRSDKFASYYLALALFLISGVVLYITLRSKVGLALKALRDSENYAISRGINPYKYKILAIILSAFLTGAVGAFYAQYLGVVGPGIMGWGSFLLVMSMLVLGGLGTLFGPMIASFILLFISEFLSGVGAYRYIILGCVMIVVLLGGHMVIVRRLQIAWTGIQSKLRSSSLPQ